MGGGRKSYAGGRNKKQRTLQERLRYNLGRSNLKLTGELEPKV